MAVVEENNRNVVVEVGVVAKTIGVNSILGFHMTS